MDQIIAGWIVNEGYRDRTSHYATRKEAEDALSRYDQDELETLQPAIGVVFTDGSQSFEV